jgi:hypothetical protein
MHTKKQPLGMAAILAALAGCNPSFNNQQRLCDDVNARPGEPCTPSATQAMAPPKADGSVAGGPPRQADADMGVGVDGGGVAQDAGPRDSALSPPDASGAVDYELRITIRGLGSGIVGEKDAFERLTCDSDRECKKFPNLRMCSTCVARYRAGTKVSLVLSPRIPSRAVDWSSACLGSRECEVVVNGDTEVTVTLDVQGASHLEATVPFGGDLSSAAVVGNDIFRLFGECDGSAVPGAKPRCGGRIERLTRSGDWAGRRAFGETWFDREMILESIRGTETGAIIARGFLFNMVEKSVAFRGLPDGPFALAPFQCDSHDCVLFRDGFLADRMINGQRHLVYFDAKENRTSDFGPRNSELGDTVGAPNAEFFMTGYSDVSKYSSTGQLIWSVGVAGVAARLDC